MIISPPKLYLDTNHLVNISKIHRGLSLDSSEIYRKDYIFIDNCIQDGRCALVFNFHAPLEWVEGRATEESALQLASIFDKAECLYGLETDTFIYASEVLEECKRVDSSVSFPELPILHYLQKGSQYTPAQTIIAQHVPDYDFGSTDKSSFPDHVPVVSIRTHATETLHWKEKNPEVYEERIKGYSETLLQDIKLARDDFVSFSQEQIVGWLKRFLQIDKILRVASPKANIDGLLGAIDISRCPATHLNLRIRESLIQNKWEPKENDCDDFIYLPVIPYAYISLIETWLSKRILQAEEKMKTRVFCKPPDAADALMNVFGHKRTGD
jgi:hypothetical protein